MERLIDKLPGVAMSVEDVTETLLHMWDGEANSDAKAMGYRASQLNLVLHFGLDTTTEEAIERFEGAVRFAQKYPCRIIVICPSDTISETGGFEGKLYSQCFIGKHLRDVCCCEALILAYSPEHPDVLESQVSTWLEPDLPVYHWLHRVPVGRVDSYRNYLKRCRRILFDGEIESDRFDTVKWPELNRVRDLAYARNLPLRQNIGQFLSGYSPEELTDGLKSLRFQYTTGCRRQVVSLMRWHKTALERCYSDKEKFSCLALTCEQLVQENAGACMRIEWKYDEAERYLIWDYDRSKDFGTLSSALPSRSSQQPFHIEPLPIESALSEAMFF